MPSFLPQLLMEQHSAQGGNWFCGSPCFRRTKSLPVSQPGSFWGRALRVAGSPGEAVPERQQWVLTSWRLRTSGQGWEQIPDLGLPTPQAEWRDRDLDSHSNIYPQKTTPALH